MKFHSRTEAGEALAHQLLKYKSEKPIVLALPNAGVVVASAIARKLEVNLDVILARKIGAPFNPDVSLGAISEQEKPTWSKRLLEQLQIKVDDLKDAVKTEQKTLAAQKGLFRANARLAPVKGQCVILVDEGLNSGATMSAAIKYLHKNEVGKIVVAVSVALKSTTNQLRKKVDQVVCLDEKSDFSEVVKALKNSEVVTDQQVVQILAETRQSLADRALENYVAMTKKVNKDFYAAIEKGLVGLNSDTDLERLVHSLKDKRIVMLGEASHGTEEFYLIRRLITERLVKDHGYKFIAVEGDWPDAYRLHRYIQKGEGLDAKSILLNNHRWPTWMWANEETVKLAESLRQYKTGFYGLDVYSLFESISQVNQFVDKFYPHFSDKFKKGYSCFEPYEHDEIGYARSLFRYPAGCEKEAINNLQTLLNIRLSDSESYGDDLFNSQQNARVVADAEAYYRSMLKGEAASWNIRDRHMMNTLDTLLEKYGPDSKCIVWAHNTHIGDYRATDMKAAGYVNIGGLARERYGSENVSLVGFGTYEGEVLAGKNWGAREQVMKLPPAKEESYEFYFHQVARTKNLNQFYLLLKNQAEFSEPKSHRAVGVVYDPKQERNGNYVPTQLSERYDAFVFIDRTHALKSLHSPARQQELPETFPSGL